MRLARINSVIQLSLILLLCAACKADIKPTDAIDSTPKSTVFVPTQTASPTLQPTYTPTPTVAASPTPLSTLLPSDAEAEFRGWLVGTSTCNFPCWADIVPGMTTWDEAVHTLSPVLNLHFSEDLGPCRFGRCKHFSWQYDMEGGLYNGSLYAKDNIIHTISLDGDVPPEYTLHGIFVRYGEPTQVFVYTNLYTYADEPPLFELIIFYKEYNFSVRYIWDAHVKGEDIAACGLADGFMMGISAIDGNQWTKPYIVFAGRPTIEDTYSFSYFQPIEEVLDIKIEPFYRNVLENDESSFCIQSPLEHWQ